ncbi:hypothetical protein HQ524_00225 [Candidatus Uhrbacteria bacterium]|nr:hypothetical protein [Candidatus Uhrbacteria bacterium]
MADVSTNEIMEFLNKHMVTKEDHDQGLKEGAGNLRDSELRMLDHMDEKLADLKGDLVVMMRKEDKKLSALIELLEKKHVIDEQEASEILQLQPFPQR